MSVNGSINDQEQNTAKLVMRIFHKLANKEGIKPIDITKYLRYKFGDVWRTSALTIKAETALKRSADLGLLERCGDRYMSLMVRDIRCKRCRHHCFGQKRKRYNKSRDR